ncbi:MAG: hypothetical protein ABSA53_38455 [Streptosporangiaceae bacterium]
MTAHTADATAATSASGRGLVRRCAMAAGTATAGTAESGHRMTAARVAEQRIKAHAGRQPGRERPA